MMLQADTSARDPFFKFAETHPRLIANRVAIDRVKLAIAGNPVGQQLKRAVVADADALESNRPVAWQPGDLLKICRRARRRMWILGIAWLVDGNRRHADRAKRELSAICGFRDWHPEHFLDTAEMTHAAAIGYDWFYDQLDDGARAACVAAILDKGLRRGLEQLSGATKNRWPDRTNNWNVVCNAALMIGALAVGETKNPLARQVFNLCLDSVPNGLRGYYPDGSMDEGPGYWSYATEYAAYLLSSLGTAVGHEFGLGDLPGLRSTGFFRMHAAGAAAGAGAYKDRVRLFNFSDCEETHEGTWCMRWLAQRYKEPKYNWVALAEAQTTPMDLLWFSQDAPGDDVIPRHAMFRGIANVAMFRGKPGAKSLGFQPWKMAADENTVYLGIRAGANSIDNHHGHLDLGSFVLDAAGQRWAIDIPPVGKIDGYEGDYKLPDFFVVEEGKRFRYYRTGTIGHNTLMINGKNQSLGVQTEIVAFAATPGLAVAVVDLTAAYPDRCLRARRGFALIDERHVLIVDELTPRKNLPVAWQMHTRAHATGGGTVRLAQGGKQFFVRMLEPDIAFEIHPAPTTPPEAENEKEIQKLVATLPVTGPARIAVLLSAKIDSIGALPAPLGGPLWSWIEWAGRQKQHDVHLF